MFLRKFCRCCLILIIFNLPGIALDSLNNNSDTIEPFIQRPPIQYDDSSHQPQLAYKPSKSLLLSALVPGGGQYYCNKKVKGTMFFASEVILISIMANRFSVYNGTLADNYFDKKRDFDSLTKVFESIEDSTERITFSKILFDSKTLKYSSQFFRNKAKYECIHTIGFSVGLYLWNLVDALHSTKAYQNQEYRNPKKAAWLSAIPILGLGQLYNGAYSKMGMIWMTQYMLLTIAINNNKLMNFAANRRNEVLEEEKKNSSLNFDEHKKMWQSRYDEAFRKRNTFFWYSIFFYFYAVIDAAVDAHLHDYSKKIRLKPHVEPEEKKVSFNFILNF